MSTQPIHLIPTPQTSQNLRRMKTWVRDGKKCRWCGKDTILSPIQSPIQATIDHVLPQHKGGTNNPDNLVNACYECNQRRNYEDVCGMVDGALLGKWPLSKSQRKSHSQKPNYYKHIALTGDEKKAIMGKTPKEKAAQSVLIMLDPIRLQRDKALQTILELRKEIKQKDEALKYADDLLKSMTVKRLILKRIGSWFLTRSGK